MKKKYVKPTVATAAVEPERPLAGSGITGTGGNITWDGEEETYAKNGDFDDWDDWEEDEEEEKEQFLFKH